MGGKPTSSPLRRMEGISNDTPMNRQQRPFGELIAANFPASLWLCKGDGDGAKGAFDRWHITSTDLHPACFPLLQRLMARRFCYGVAFHGFQRKEDEADVYIGGAASRPLKTAIERALNDLDLPITVKISTGEDDPKFQGFSPDNIINRLTTSGIHLEQSVEARKNLHGEIARAVAEVFASRWRFLLCSSSKISKGNAPTPRPRGVQGRSAGGEDQSRRGGADVH